MSDTINKKKRKLDVSGEGSIKSKSKSLKKSKTKIPDGSPPQISKQKIKKGRQRNKNKSQKLLNSNINDKEDDQSNSQEYVIENDEHLKKRKPKTKQVKRLNRIEERKLSTLPTKHPDAEKRTLYVGNVKLNTKKKALLKFFSQYGEVECLRFRGIPGASEDTWKKEAFVKLILDCTTAVLLHLSSGSALNRVFIKSPWDLKDFHPMRDSMIAYVRFTSIDSKEAALQANGQIFEGHHLTVDNATPSPNKNKHTVFIGNLPWEVKDEEIWNLFSVCGKIVGVRMVRSSTTGAGKGIGYVSFENKEGVKAALRLNEKVLHNRALRVKPAATNERDLLKQGRAGARKKATIATMLTDQKKNKMNVGFLKADKPKKDLGGTKFSKKPKKMKEKGFTGNKIENKKKKRRWSQVEKKRHSVAKILANAK